MAWFTGLIGTLVYAGSVSAYRIPDRAMRRLLAEALTQIAIAALPMFGGRFDRALIYILLYRRTLDRDRATPVLALADSLGIPFETTRRHVAALTREGMCRRTRGGIVSTNVPAGSPVAVFADLAHDVFVQFLARLHAIGGLPPGRTPTRDYNRPAGQQVCVDLVLSLIHTTAPLFRDRLDMVLHATVLALNAGRINADEALSARYATKHEVPPDELLQPVRVRRLSQLLGLSEATVRRRLVPCMGQTLHNTHAGLVMMESWARTPPSLDVGVRAAGDLRRALGALTSHGFPFHDISNAYRRGPPPAIAGN